MGIYLHACRFEKDLFEDLLHPASEVCSCFFEKNECFYVLNFHICCTGCLELLNTSELPNLQFLNLYSGLGH